MGRPRATRDQHARGRSLNDLFTDRRSRVINALGTDGALVLAANHELRVGDTDLRYHPSPDLYWLSGITEPEAVLVLAPSADQVFTIFVRQRDAERERWTGPRHGVDAAREMFGADAAYPIGELAERLPKLLAGATTLYAPLESYRPDVDAALRAALLGGLNARPRTGRGIHTLTAARVLLAPMRLRKDTHELVAMRRAADITVNAFDDAAHGVRAAHFEYGVETMIEHGFRSRGATGPAFPTIAAAGANATVLHYIANDASLDDGDLLLVDAGARVDMYCADITRTFPISGRFTPEQRAVYDVVLAAHDVVIDHATVGSTTANLDDIAWRTLTLGMIDLGLLSGSVDELIEKKEYKRWFPHRVSHWIGLDVHDPGDYVTADGPVRLAENMVLTVEPGLYVPADAADAPAGLRGIGIRLEDDVAITAVGPDVLTRALPIRAHEVELLVSR